MRRKHSRQLLRVAIIAALTGSLSATAQNIPPGLTCVQATYPRNSVAVGGATGYCVPPAQAGIGSYSTCYTGANSNSTTVDVCASSCVAEPTTVNATLQDGYDPSAQLRIPPPSAAGGATFHTHMKGPGMPSTPQNNVTGSSEKGDTLAAVQSGFDVYVISSNGLAIAPASSDDPTSGKDSSFIIQGKNFSDWFKALKALCAKLAAGK